MIIQISAKIIRERHVPNSVIPLNNFNPPYNIGKWVVQLNLQQIAIVEIGDSYCAVSKLNKKIHLYCFM